MAITEKDLSAFYMKGLKKYDEYYKSKPKLDYDPTEVSFHTTIAIATAIAATNRQENTPYLDATAVYNRINGLLVAIKQLKQE